jgi:prostaglandin-endoperoxide synthase 2
MNLSNSLVKLAEHAPWLVKRIQSIHWLNSFLNAGVIHALVTKGAGRPQPFSLWTPTPVGGKQLGDPADPPVDYISWTSLVDRRFTARHLPPADQAYVDRLPKMDDVVDLYKRAAFIPSKTTSALLCFFAQWFTDSVLRTAMSDRRMNTSNHEIDLCQIYGLDAETAAILRTHTGGRLRTSPDGLYPARMTDDNANPVPEFRELSYLKPMKDGTSLGDLVLGTLEVPPAELLARKKRLYATGLERGNSTVIYAAISTIFIREHNRICGKLALAYPSWDDDQLFETARNVNIVMLLCLVINEYINHLAQSTFKLSLERHFAEHTTWYRANRIAIEFDLLYRWHSLTPTVLTVNGVKLSGDDYRFNNALLEQYGVETVIAAASREPAGRIGMGNNPDFLLKAEMAAHKFAREQRVRPFVEYQNAFHEDVVKDFKELAGDTPLAARLATLYPRGVEDVEFLVGLFAQGHDDNGVLPGLMRTMVAVDAFSQILTNPLLAANVYCEAAFSAVGNDIINATHSFQDLVARNCAPGAEKAVYASFALSPPKPTMSTPRR